MGYDLDKRVENDIKRLAEACGIEKVVLFGSRARGDNSPRSDIDLALYGGNIRDFSLSIDDFAHTLLMFDVVNMDNAVTDELKNEIGRDGVVIYEKV